MQALVSPEFVWLAEGLLTALVVGLLLALLTGLLLLARPSALFAATQRLNRWVDTSERFRRLEEPHYWERLFYRHHRLIGGAVSGGAAYVLWCWLLATPRASATAVFGIGPAALRNAWLAEALDSLIVGLHVFVLAVGLAILLRPSLLKNLERAANQWHQVPAGLPLDAVVANLDGGFALYPRLSGFLLVLASAGCLASLLPVLFTP